MLQAFAKALLSKPAAPTPGVPERLSYYKCNMNSIVGDGQTIPWPLYTSRLDIEPELATVYGNTLQPLAGFCIFNDGSARHVQAQEFVGGFCLRKDMDKGNQLGPYLVTADEVGNPYALKVVVKVDGQVRYQGSTAEIDHSAEDAFAGSDSSRPSSPERSWAWAPFRTAPRLDHDDFIDPGAEIEIGFERLGSLRCRFAEPARKLLPSPWPLRLALQRFHEV